MITKEGKYDSYWFHFEDGYLKMKLNFTKEQLSAIKETLNENKNL